MNNLSIITQQTIFCSKESACTTERLLVKHSDYLYVFVVKPSFKIIKVLRTPPYKHRVKLRVSWLVGAPASETKTKLIKAAKQPYIF